MAVVRDIEPWDALLEAGREDERLVMQAAQNRRAAQAVALPERAASRAWRRRCARAGVDRLWSHQAEALYAAWAGPTIVTTGTASGKSLCFQLPTLDMLCRDARARALYLYPAKALAQDQARSLPALGVARARPAIYDGDTPREQRAQIRRRANLVLTNPDMLHLGILPNHRAWADFFANLAAGRGRRGARLPRRVRLPRRATCCGGCGAIARPTGRSRASCWPARRSPTRGSWPSG